MAEESPVAQLEAELELGEAVAETLERQRSALLERDLNQMNELTDVLENQLRQFAGLLEGSPAREASIPATGPQRALLERVRRTRVRVMELADFNEKLIADRLAWSNAMLTALGMTDAGPGYAPEGQRRSGSKSAVSRSA